MPNSKNRKILIIDDDKQLQELLHDYFREHPFDISSAFCGREGAAAVREQLQTPFDLIILDIMLPDLDGFETLRSIRTISDVPVIMLTARSDKTDRIIGLEMGADDYMHKPFDPRELLARIKAVLRRAAPRCGAPREAPQGFTTGPFRIDPATCRVFKDGNSIRLSAVEFDILTALARSPGRPLSRDHLLDVARGREFEAFDRSIDVHISRIRKKIEDHPSRPAYIKTVWGKGYAWEDGGAGT